MRPARLSGLCTSPRCRTNRQAASSKWGRQANRPLRLLDLQPAQEGPGLQIAPDQTVLRPIPRKGGEPFRGLLNFPQREEQLCSLELGSEVGGIRRGCPPELVEGLFLFSARPVDAREVSAPCFSLEGY